MMEKEKKDSKFVTLDSLEPRKPQILNQNIEELKKVLFNTHPLIENIDELTNLFDRANITFLIELSNKIPIDDYRSFINSLLVVKKQGGSLLIQKGRKPFQLSILLQGEITYNIEMENCADLMCIGVGEVGQLIYPQAFMTPKYVNFTIKCEQDCSFLSFSEESYNRYIKKYLIKQTDAFVEYLNNTTIFGGLSTLNLRKYSAYFIPKTYKYNEMVYLAGSTVDEIYLIMEGAAELISRQNDRNSVSIVKLTRGQSFGIESEQQNVRHYSVKSVSKLKVFVLNINVMNMIKSEFQLVSQNLKTILKKIEKVHSSLLNRNIHILSHKDEIGVIAKKKKKKKERGKSLARELKWWGLAENVKIQKKYRISLSPKANETYFKKFATNEDSASRTLMTHKIKQLRRRIFENQLQNYKEYNDQIEEDEQLGEKSPWQTTNYVPRVKNKIRMLDVKPKAINMAEGVKKKLIAYAKNMNSFCDRLNLQ